MSLATALLPCLAFVGDPTGYVTYFLVASLVVAVVTAAIRLREPREIWRESSRFFVTIVLGIGVLSALVWALDWALVH